MTYVDSRAWRAERGGCESAARKARPPGAARQGLASHREGQELRRGQAVQERWPQRLSDHVER